MPSCEARLPAPVCCSGLWLLPAYHSREAALVSHGVSVGPELSRGLRSPQGTWDKPTSAWTDPAWARSRSHNSERLHLAFLTSASASSSCPSDPACLPGSSVLAHSGCPGLFFCRWISLLQCTDPHLPRYFQSRLLTSSGVFTSF